MLRIVVHSDLGCPFCYLGETTLSRLEAEWAFTSEWEPFELHPEVPEDGVDVTEKSAGRLEELFKQVLWVAGPLKVPLNPPSAIPNSRRALCAVLALRQDHPAASAALRARLFEACYVEGRKISTPEQIAEVAAEVLTPAQAELALEATRSEAAQTALRAAKERGFDALVTGVPIFRFFAADDERLDYRVMGAQPAEIFERVFEALEVPRR